MPFVDLAGAPKLNIEEVSQIFSGQKKTEKPHRFVQIVHNGEIIADIKNFSTRSFADVVTNGHQEYTRSDWKFHVSIDTSSAENYKKSLITIFNFCKKNNLQFKFVKWDKLSGFATGDYTQQEGKIFTIYLPKNQEKKIGHQIIDNLGAQLKN